MTRIGTFTATGEGFEGRLQTLAIDANLVIVPAEPGSGDHAPDYRVMAGKDAAAREVGAGWKRVGDKAGPYVALLIDDPCFTRALRANLFHSDKGTHVLTWSRASRRDERG